MRKKIVLVGLMCLILAFAGSGISLASERPHPAGVEPLATDMNVTIKGNRATVLYDSVGSTTDAFNLEQLILNRNIRFVDLYLANGGGNVFLMMDFLDMMERQQKRGVFFTGYGRALIASAAVPIFVKCDLRIMAPHSWVMIHPGSWRNDEAESYRGPMPECYQKLFRVVERTYARVVADNSNMGFFEVLAILQGRSTNKDQVWYTAQEALEKGLCDVVEGYEYHKDGPVENPSEVDLGAPF